jgi:hypothetical protein
MSEHTEMGLLEYHDSCAAITARFAEASHRIRAVESQLQEGEAAAAQRIARGIRGVQELEKEKLQLVTAHRLSLGLCPEPGQMRARDPLSLFHSAEGMMCRREQPP